MKDNIDSQGHDMVGVSWFDRPIDQDEIDYMVRNRTWLTANGRKINVNEMSDDHIRSCIKCWKGEGDKVIPSSYLGGKKVWLEIFYAELLKRAKKKKAVIVSNVYGAIADIQSALIPETIQRKALLEVCRMASDRKYARRVGFKYRSDCYQGIDSMFLWDKTDAGKRFWEKLYKILS